MILQDEFKKNGYIDLLQGENSHNYEIDLNDFFDEKNKPVELLNLFISDKKDDLFFILDGDYMNINDLCDQWDDRIRVFSVINRNSKNLHKLIYNIIQLIVSSNDILDESKEGNLQISRKIIIKGIKNENTKIEVEEDAMIELPFYMIPENSFNPNLEQKEKLIQLLPTDKEILNLLEKANRKVKRSKDNNGEINKSFLPCDFDKIKEWLQK